MLYSSEAFPTEFNDSNVAMKLINDYVKNKTQGKIEELFKDLSPRTVLVLVNYIYFKGGCLFVSEGNTRLVLCLQTPLINLPVLRSSGVLSQSPLNT